MLKRGMVDAVADIVDLITTQVGTGAEENIAEIRQGDAGGEPAVLSPQAEPSPFRFTEIAGESGIDFVHFSGTTAEKYFPTANGSGVAMFDYDNDGRLDLFVAGFNASLQEIVADQIGQSAKGERPRLYHNLGAAVMEELVVADGRPLNANLAEYKLPTQMDMPNFTTRLVPTHVGPGPFGVKAAGEVLIIDHLVGNGGGDLDLGGGAGALGLLYVVEGATLGGQVISRRLEVKLAFFRGYGEATGRMWRETSARLRAVSNPAAQDEAVRSAVSCFTLLRRWLGAS